MESAGGELPIKLVSEVLLQDFLPPGVDIPKSYKLLLKRCPPVPSQVADLLRQEDCTL